MHDMYGSEVDTDDSLDGREYEDYNHLFHNLGSFPSREEAQKVVIRIGRDNNMFFTVASSKKSRVYMGCERGGKYRETICKNEDGVPRRRSGTKKNNCQFQIKLKKKAEGEWVIKTSENRGRHNHHIGDYPNWHTSAVKLSQSESEFVH